MTDDHKFEDRVRGALADISGVREKRMFGSLGFIVRGKLCISARAERMMCRIDPAIYDTELKKPGCRAVIMKGSESRGYVYVDSEYLKSNSDLQYWIDRALEYIATIS